MTSGAYPAGNIYMVMQTPSIHMISELKVTFSVSFLTVGGAHRCDKISYK
jgi:hypothetical protein